VISLNILAAPTAIIAWIRGRERHTLRLQLEGRAGGVHLGCPFTRTLGGSRPATLCSATLLCTRRETTSSISVRPAGYHATSTESAPHIAAADSRLRSTNTNVRDKRSDVLSAEPQRLGQC